MEIDPPIFYKEILTEAFPVYYTLVVAVNAEEYEHVAGEAEANTTFFM